MDFKTAKTSLYTAQCLHAIRFLRLVERINGLWSHATATRFGESDDPLAIWKWKSELASAVALLAGSVLI
jgi:hypothetical protein